MLIISTTYDSESAVLTENKISYVKMYLKLLRRLRANIFFHSYLENCWQFVKHLNAEGT